MNYFKNLHRSNTVVKGITPEQLYSAIGINGLRIISDAEINHHTALEGFFETCKPPKVPYSHEEHEKLSTLDDPGFCGDYLETDSLNNIDTRLFWKDYRPYGCYGAQP